MWSVYEVIYGHRRLRACQELKLPVWIIVVQATDEELFYAMDMENRQRKNPSPFELGDSYRRALENGLFASLRALAARLNIDPGYASRAYNIAKLPPEVLDAFPSRTAIQFKWGKDLSDALQRDPEGVIARAKGHPVGGRQTGGCAGPSAASGQSDVRRRSPIVADPRPWHQAGRVHRGRRKGQRHGEAERIGGFPAASSGTSVLAGQVHLGIRESLKRMGRSLVF
jgi:ParB/RepB/Spo0J family partition protein